MADSDTKVLSLEEAEQQYEDAIKGLDAARVAYEEAQPRTVIQMVRCATRSNIQSVNTQGGIQFRFPVLSEVLPEVDPANPTNRHNTVHCSMPRVMVEELVPTGKVKIVGKLPDLEVASVGFNSPDHTALADYLNKYPITTEYISDEDFKGLKPRKSKLKPIEE